VELVKLRVRLSHPRFLSFQLTTRPAPLDDCKRTDRYNHLGRISASSINTCCSRSRRSDRGRVLCLIAQIPNQSPKVAHSDALIPCRLTAAIKLEYDDQYARKAFLGLTAQGLPPLSPKIAFSVQTGMLTSLCAIGSFISVSHPAQVQVAFLTQADAVRRFT